MLHEIDQLPRGLLDAGPHELCRLLPGPSLLHLEGRRKKPLFIAVLLHGDEETGWMAARELLRRYRKRALPRSLSLFIGNVSAAREGKRSLPGQCDYNRIWSGNGARLSPEESMAAAVVDAMRKRDVFVTVDVHNNTGLNPHYAYVQRLENRFLQLASVFGRLVVFSRKPEGTLCGAFSALCPSVAVECGRAEDPGGVPHTLDFLEACLRAVVRIPDTASFSFDGSEADFVFRDDLDRLNFQELATGSRLAGLPRGMPASLEVRDENDLDVAEHYFSLHGGELRSAAPFIPAMFTVSEEAVRQDCLGYLMERMGAAREGAAPGD